MFPDATVAKILVQRDRCATSTVLFAKLPDSLAGANVLIFEPMIATGGSVCKAIDTVLTHRAVPRRVQVLSILMSPTAANYIPINHPDIRFVTGSIEEELSEEFFMVPGIGDFGDRYWRS